MPEAFQILAVQSGESAHNSKCERDLDSKLQRRYGVRLNTSRQARAACGVVSLRIASTPVNSRRGDFPTRLNRKTALCHTVRRNMTGPASAGARVRARETTHPSIRMLTGQQKSKTSARLLFLEWAEVLLLLSLYGRVRAVTPQNPLHVHPGHTWRHGKLSYFFPGSLSVFCSVFPFNLFLTESVR